MYVYIKFNQLKQYIYMNYMIFYTGLVSTPNTIGLKNLSTNEVIHQISCACETGKETRKKYNKYCTLLKSKYGKLVIN